MDARTTSDSKVWGTENSNDARVVPTFVCRIEDAHNGLEPSHPTENKISSRYDFVKVKVQLNHLESEDSDQNGRIQTNARGHYYVLSRFLIMRYLAGTGINIADANRIALRVKKQLVSLNELRPTQRRLEDVLFTIMRTEFGYGEKYCDAYRFLTIFYTNRIPLLILMYGTVCTGKSTLCRMLAETLNTPTVLHTQVAVDTLDIVNSGRCREAPWELHVLDDLRELCGAVAKGMRAELRSAAESGKIIIVEGVHVDVAEIRSLYDGLRPPTVCTFCIHIPADQHILQIGGEEKHKAAVAIDEALMRLNAEAGAVSVQVDILDYSKAVNFMHNRLLEVIKNLTVGMK